MYDPIGCILDEEKRLVIFDTRGMEYKRENIEKIICRYQDVVWNCVEENVATGCNRTPDRHSRENRPLKKGIQTGGK